MGDILIGGDASGIRVGGPPFRLLYGLGQITPGWLNRALMAWPCRPWMA